MLKMSQENQGPTREEQQRTNLKATLENKVIQNVVGSNLVKSNPMQYGQMGMQGGEATYQESMNSEEVQQIKQEDYQRKKQEGAQLGVAGEPTPLSNYDISIEMARQVQEVMTMVNLGDLEEVIKTIVGNLAFQVPEQLKQISHKDIISKAMARQELSEQEKDAMASYQILSEAYMRTTAHNASQSNYLTDINAQGAQIMEKYNPSAQEE